MRGSGIHEVNDLRRVFLKRGPPAGALRPVRFGKNLEPPPKYNSGPHYIGAVVLGEATHTFFPTLLTYTQNGGPRNSLDIRQSSFYQAGSPVRGSFTHTLVFDFIFIPNLEHVKLIWFYRAFAPIFKNEQRV